MHNIDFVSLATTYNMPNERYNIFDVDKNKVTEVNKLIHQTYSVVIE